MNIFKRLFNWIQSGPVDFSYVTGEWGFKKGNNRPGPANNAFQEPSTLHIPVKLPTKVAAGADNGAVAARVVTPVTNGTITVTVSAQVTSEAHDPVLADLFASGPAPDAQESDAYTHVQR